jgi:D-alanyl-D-alanine carboxypeptidase
MPKQLFRLSDRDWGVSRTITAACLGLVVPGGALVEDYPDFLESSSEHTIEVIVGHNRQARTDRVRSGYSQSPRADEDKKGQRRPSADEGSHGFDSAAIRTTANSGTEHGRRRLRVVAGAPNIFVSKRFGPMLQG